MCCVRVWGWGSCFTVTLWLQRSICGSSATFAFAPFIRDETKQFPPSLFLPLSHIFILLGHRDLDGAAAGLQHGSALKVSSGFGGITEGAHAVVGKAISPHRVWRVTLHL